MAITLPNTSVLREVCWQSGLPPPRRAKNAGGHAQRAKGTQKEWAGLSSYWRVSRPQCTALSRIMDILNSENTDLQTQVSSGSEKMTQPCPQREWTDETPAPAPAPASNALKLRRPIQLSDRRWRWSGPPRSTPSRVRASSPKDPRSPMTHALSPVTQSGQVKKTFVLFSAARVEGLRRHRPVRRRLLPCGYTAFAAKTPPFAVCSHCLREQNTAFCRVFALPSCLKQCLCLVSPPPVCLRHRLLPPRLIQARGAALVQEPRGPGVVGLRTAQSMQSVRLQRDDATLSMLPASHLFGRPTHCAKHAAGASPLQTPLSTFPPPGCRLSSHEICAHGRADHRTSSSGRA